MSKTPFSVGERGTIRDADGVARIAELVERHDAEDGTLTLVFQTDEGQRIRLSRGKLQSARAVPR